MLASTDRDMDRWVVTEHRINEVTGLTYNRSVTGTVLR